VPETLGTRFLCSFRWCQLIVIQTASLDGGLHETLLTDWLIASHATARTVRLTSMTVSWALGLTLPRKKFMRLCIPVTGGGRIFCHPVRGWTHNKLLQDVPDPFRPLRALRSVQEALPKSQSSSPRLLRRTSSCRVNMNVGTQS
jgi:hypothetical protein